MSRRRNRRADRPDQQGRTRGNDTQRIDTAGGKGVVVIPQGVITSPAFVDLSPLAVKVLVAIQSHWNGYNNGRLHLSTRRLHEVCGTVDNKSQARAVRELVDHGFIEITSGSDFNCKRLAREFRLTYIAGEVGRQSTPPTSEFRNWRPAERAETIEGVSRAGNKPIALVSHAGNETSARVSHAIETTAPREAERSTARVSHALIYTNHSRSSGARHDPEWMRESAAKMLATAQRGAKARLAEAIHATPVQLSRLLNHGTPLPAAASDRLALILNNGSERRRFAGAAA